jgi:hypothetical protein
MNTTQPPSAEDNIVEKALADASVLYEQYLQLSKVTNVTAVLTAPLQETKMWGTPLTFVIQREN